MKLSLIIPIYKVEMYIETCLKSITAKLPQEDVEIIIVDDGSPDQSINIISAFLTGQCQEVRNLFKIVRQENQGVSAARNYGIEQATGEYLAFLDSDDYLYDDYFDSLLNVIRQFEPDIIEFRAQRVNNERQYSSFLEPMASEGLQPLDEKNWIRISNQCAWFPWLRIYKASLFKDISFPKEMSFVEDAYTIPYVCMKAENIYFLNQDLVYYRFNPQGATSTVSIQHIEDLKSVIYKMIEHLAINPTLSASVMSLTRYYIKDSIGSESIINSYKRWKDVKNKLAKSQAFDEKYVNNRADKLLLYFGMVFLIFYFLITKRFLFLYD